MNNHELESLLKKARLPDIAEESLEAFPRQIAARLRIRDHASRMARKPSPLFAWAFGLAACAVIAFSVGRWSGQKEAGTAPTTDNLASAKFINGMLAMFPNRVRAIVENEHGLSLVLSDHDDVPTSPPLYVHICDGQHCSSFVTFSGEQIQVAGQTITVLADTRGGIILTGDQFVWSNTGQTHTGKNLKIEAKNLGAAAM